MYMDKQASNKGDGQVAPADRRAFLLSLRKPVYVGVAMAVAVVALHGMASVFGWYWIFRWFDNPMHVLGGMFAGFLGLVAYAARTMRFNPPLWIGVGAALLIGIAWEFLERAYGLAGLDPIHRFDTIKDLINDMMGGVGSLLVWHLFIKNTHSNQTK